MEHSKLPLSKWLLAIYLISQAKTGLSALAMKHQLGVSYPTAWLLHHKINRVMTAQDRQQQIGGMNWPPKNGRHEVWYFDRVEVL